MARPRWGVLFARDEGQHQQPADQAAQADGAQSIEMNKDGLLRDIAEAPQSGSKKKQQIGLQFRHGPTSLSWLFKRRLIDPPS